MHIYLIKCGLNGPPSTIRKYTLSIKIHFIYIVVIELFWTFIIHGLNGLPTVDHIYSLHIIENWLSYFVMYEI